MKHGDAITCMFFHYSNAKEPHRTRLHRILRNVQVNKRDLHISAIIYGAPDTHRDTVPYFVDNLCENTALPGSHSRRQVTAEQYPCSAHESINETYESRQISRYAELIKQKAASDNTTAKAAMA